MVSTHPEAVPSSGSGVLFEALPRAGPNTTGTSSGVSSVMISTRRYCMNATRRSSAPRSLAIATIPEAPPATMPSEAVGRSSVETRASTMPAPIVTANVAMLTRITGIQRVPSPVSTSACRNVPSATPVTACPIWNPNSGSSSRPVHEERVAEPGQQRREQITGRHTDLPQQPAAGDRDSHHDPPVEPGAAAAVGTGTAAQSGRPAAVTLRPGGEERVHDDRGGRPRGPALEPGEGLLPRSPAGRSSTSSSTTSRSPTPHSSTCASARR